ncbi:MAG: hypothetical protein JXA79_07265 [Deltaproteobacteria bacterium]|nr:hypothetical protein [Deltaproteobacteria bacterium]
MPEIKIEFKRWQAIVIAVVLIVVVAVRFMTLKDLKNDKDLMKQIDSLLMDEYSSHVAEKLRTSYEIDDEGTIEKSVESITSTKVNIVSVQASYPFFDFSTPKKVVIKVVFSLDEANEPGDRRTIYYQFKHGVFGWQHNYITTSLSYYLNFI